MITVLLLATKMRRFFLVQILGISKQISFIPLMSRRVEKVVCNGPTDMTRSSTISRIMIRRFSIIIFFNGLTFPMAIDILGRPGRTSSLIIALVCCEVFVVFVNFFFLLKIDSTNGTVDNLSETKLNIDTLISSLIANPLKQV